MKKRLRNDYRYPDMLPEINTSDMAGTMKAIKEYLKSYCGVVRAPLAYIIRKNVIVQT